jgi:hypothetical protein
MVLDDPEADESSGRSGSLDMEEGGGELIIVDDVAVGLRCLTGMTMHRC